MEAASVMLDAKPPWWLTRTVDEHSSTGRHLRCMFHAALQSLYTHLPGCAAGCGADNVQSHTLPGIHVKVHASGTTSQQREGREVERHCGRVGMMRSLHHGDDKTDNVQKLRDAFNPIKLQRPGPCASAVCTASAT
ncbi:hypothetical protein HaLaN_14174 [Haematococcus lacustris]|uniref:Uncharacterized protein n=1 Tax=Haematococcus lacustris TaxID=44745 RepID=A0A699ZDV8_HAELA|nr:hypothetical protein HaLaN_14174 [Haematococcus lacustris]